MFQTTSTGATYLQAFILCCMLIGIVCCLIWQMIQNIKYAKKKLAETKLDNLDQKELFKQINHHTPIDGYKIFTEKQTGSRYTVTFLSKNNNRCVLAEVEDFTDPQGIIKIIAF